MQSSRLSKRLLLVVGWVATGCFSDSPVGGVDTDSGGTATDASTSTTDGTTTSASTTGACTSVSKLYCLEK